MKRRERKMKRQQSIISWMVVQENMNPTIKEVIQVKRREGLRSWMYIMVIAVAVISIALLPVQAKAGGTSYTITAIAGPNGKITPSGSVAVGKGKSQGFTITPNANCTILDVKVDGVSQGPIGSYPFTNVQAAHKIQATFCSGAKYTITVTQGTNGSITPAGSVQVCQGLDQTFTIVPNANFTLENVMVEGGNQPFPDYTYTFKSVTTNHTISASFVPDSDNDGLSDAQEQAGIWVGSTFYTNCGPNPPDRTLCLDPATKDLFLILLPASPTSLLPSNPLEFVTKSQSQGGLGITVHPINQNQVLSGTDRNVTPSQKVVRVNEIVDTSTSNVLGESDSCGTPNGMDNARIYTQRISDFVNSIYPGAPSSLKETYIKQVIAHEIGHMVGPLKSPYDANCGGYHYCTIQPPGKNVIMEQSVYHSGTTFYIGAIYTTADQGNIKLK
jgi:hypothetical protein